MVIYIEASMLSMTATAADMLQLNASLVAYITTVS
jgi:hypothetical protein